MTSRPIADRLAHLEAQRAARMGTGLDADLLAHLPTWWAHLTDAELERIASMKLTDAELAPSDPVERHEYLAIEAACKARDAG